jgi:superfamily II helicase
MDVNICDVFRNTAIGKLGIRYHGQNMVIRAFTGAGKTLFVLCDVIKWALDNNYTVIYTTSLRSAVKEFMDRATSLYGSENIGYLMGVDVMGNRMTAPIKETEWSKPVVVSTYEQAVMRFMRGETRNILVIDEYHNVMTHFRKYKLLFLLAVAKMKNIPTIIMSATMPDKYELAKYLDAELIDVGSNWDNKEVSLIRLPAYKEKVLRKYLNGIISSRSSLGERGIIYINSRRLCKELGKALGIPCVTGEMSEFEKQLRLEKLRNNEVKWIIATSTLAESINEPFDDVVIIMNPLTAAFEVTQMAGRAGRFGNKAVVYVLYTASTEKCVKYALEEKYGHIYVTRPEYPDLVAAYAELVNREDVLKDVIASTFGISEPPEQVIKIALHYNVIQVRNNVVSLTPIGQWMNRFLAKYEEYEAAKNCMVLNRNPYAAWFCFTLVSSGRGFPQLNDDVRNQYRDKLKALLGRDPFRLTISLPPKSVYRAYCGDLELDIMDLVATYNISLNVGDWLVHVITDMGRKYSVYYELPYTKQKMEALGLEFNEELLPPIFKTNGKQEN